jgi:hypothetical protein
VNEAVADKDRVSETFRRQPVRLIWLAESTLLADWLSLSLVEKKKAGTVLVCNEQNSCVGLGRLAHGFCSEHRSEKFRPCLDSRLGWPIQHSATPSTVALLFSSGNNCSNLD